MDIEANENKKTFLALLTLIILLIILSVGIWWLKRVNPKNVAITTDKTAPNGALVEGVSKDYILDRNAEITNSQDLSYSTPDASAKSKIYTATFMSNMSASELFSSYLNYIQINGYKIDMSTTTQMGLSIHASSPTESMTVLIQDDSKLGPQRVVSITITK